MGKYIFKRILMMIPVLIGVSILVFLIQAFTPGDPADLVLGAQQSEETKYIWRDKYDLNDNIVVQYGKYMYRLVTKGDFGTSYITGTSVNSDLARRLPISLTLAGITTMVREEQKAKASSSIRSKPSGKMIVFRFSHRQKAFCPMLVMPSSMVTEAREVLSSNARASMATTSRPSTTLRMCRPSLSSSSSHPLTV